MQEFVQSGGATIGSDKRQIFKKNRPKTITVEEDPTINMTPKEKVAYRKEQQI
jgi:hypothetical protein